MQSKQQDVFDYSIRSTVDDILNGYNGTVFAYGQVRNFADMRIWFLTVSDRCWKIFHDDGRKR